MTEARFTRDSWLEERLTTALDGDEKINAVTREDPDIAQIIGRYIETSYGLGIEYVSRLREYRDHDIDAQWEIGKVALDCLDTANQRAEDKARELGII